jgi:DNA polymerase family B
MPRVLQRNHSTALPYAIVILDTEAVEERDQFRTNTVHQSLYFGKATYIRYRKGKRGDTDSFTFTTAVQFWQWLLPRMHKKTCTWLFAHNLGYDLTLVDFWQLIESRILSFHNPCPQRKKGASQTDKPQRRTGMYVDADPPTIIQCYDAKGSQLLCLDSLNYWPIPLAELGRMQGIPKLPRPSYAAPDAAWELYNGRDVDILQRAVVDLINFVRDNDYGKFRWTAAGQAMAAFRHRFMRHSICLDRPDDIVALERQAYYGGRIEILKTGIIDEEVFELDVSSMYPSVMINNYFPTKLVDSYLDRRDYDPAKHNPGLFTVAECLVCSDGTPYPVRCKDGTYYCTGSFWTTLCGSDLLAAIVHGHVRAFGRWARYRLQRVFASYVEHFWGERQRYGREGNELAEHFCKSMLNSLYGKFGQQSAHWEECEPPLEPWMWGQRAIRNAETGDVRKFRSIGGFIQEEQPPSEHKQAFPAISAWVTAYARQRMRQLVAIAGSRNVFYVVNDALYVNQAGLINLQLAGEVTEGELGKLRQKRYGPNAEFWAPNNYRVGDERIVAGVHRNAKQVGTHIYEEESFQRLKDITASRPNSHIDVTLRTKVLVSKIKRCHVGSDGWTYPITLYADGAKHLSLMRQRHKLPTLAEFAAYPRDK